MTNQSKLHACQDAERLYNTIVEWLCDCDTDTTTDDQIKRLTKVYNDTLDLLYSKGIGGVLINGTFRNTIRN